MSFDSIPIWLLIIATFIVVMISIEAGYRLGRVAHRRSEDEKESPVSVIVGSILALLAFILAFSFSIVTERYDARKSLVREEANVIRTVWLRSAFLPVDDRMETRRLLRTYLDMRVEAAQGRSDPRSVQKLIIDAERIQDRLWDVAAAHAYKDMNSDVAALYIESLNEMFDIQASRVVFFRMRIPMGIWWALYCMVLLGMMSVGYQTGIAGSKRSMARPILALSFTIVIAIIALLDRPDSGYLKVTQQPLVDLQSWMSGMGK